MEFGLARKEDSLDRLEGRVLTNYPWRFRNQVYADFQ